MYQMDKSREDIWVLTSAKFFKKNLYGFLPSFVLHLPSSIYLNIINDILPLWKCPGGCLGHFFFNKALALFSDPHLLSLCSFILLVHQQKLSMTLTKTCTSLGFGGISTVKSTHVKHSFPALLFISTEFDFPLKPLYSEAVKYLNSAIELRVPTV